MKRLLPKRGLQIEEILLIPEAFYHLILSWFKVQFIPSKRYLPVFNPLQNNPVSSLQEQKAKVVSSVINGLSKRTIWTSTCLIKAMAAHKMLIKRGIKHQLHFGVAKNDDKTLEAHAWLSVNDVILVGGEDVKSFKEVKGGGN
jgi:hypothetical protein